MIDIKTKYYEETGKAYSTESIDFEWSSYYVEWLEKIAEQALSLGGVSFSAEWTDEKVIDFINWYIELHKLGINYKLENKSILTSFKNGDAPSKWY